MKVLTTGTAVAVCAVLLLLLPTVAAARQSRPAAQGRATPPSRWLADGD